MAFASRRRGERYGASVREVALSLARAASDPGQARNSLREYLQALVLRSLHESEAMRSLAFVGGTALRFLHGLPRFSEDLNFSIVEAADYAGQEWMAKVKRDLALAGLEPVVSWNDSKTVHTGWVRLPGVLHEAGLSAMPDERLAIKLEIDTRPPSGARCERRVVTRHVTFLVQYYDLPSLMAGKLHALLVRRYPKGRDWYDLVWYLSQRPAASPNEPLLQNALDQTEGAGKHDARRWRDLVRARMDALDMQSIRDDVAPFLERPRDAKLLTRTNLTDLLRDGGDAVLS